MASRGPAQEWASTRSWGDDNEVAAVRRDKFGRKITEPAALEGTMAKSSTGRTHEPQHINVAGHSGLKKKVLKAGNDSRGTPPNGARVTIHVVGHLPVDKDGNKVSASDPSKGYKFFSTRERIIREDAHVTISQINATTAPGPQTFKLGAGTVLPAWDLTVPTMLVGEVCEVISTSDFAYGDEGAEHLTVPPRCPIVFHLELLEWKPGWPEREPMEDSARFELAGELKARGTERFKLKAWVEARELYEQAAYYLSDAFLGNEALKSASDLELGKVGANAGIGAALAGADAPSGPPMERFAGQNDEAKAVLIACLLNASMCCLKAETWRDAEALAGRALLLEPKNAKGLFRRGTARTKMGDFGDARADLRRACELDPKSKDVREMFEECKLAEQAERQAQRDFYAKTGAASGGYEAPEEEEKEKLFVC